METNHLDVVDFGKAPDVEVHDDQRGRVWKKIEKESSPIFFQIDILIFFKVHASQACKAS